MKHLLPLFVMAIVCIVIGIFAIVRNEVVLGIVPLYFSCVFLSLPLEEYKYTRWIFRLVLIPLLVITPFVKNIFTVMMTAVGIFIPFLLINTLFVVMNTTLEFESSKELIMYLSLSIGTAIAILKPYQRGLSKLLKFTTKPLNDVTYEISTAKYLIYTFYFIILTVSYFERFTTVALNPNNNVLLAAFATFLAFDRLLANKKMVENIDFSDARNIHKKLKCLFKQDIDE